MKTNEIPLNIKDKFCYMEKILVVRLEKIKPKINPSLLRVQVRLECLDDIMTTEAVLNFLKVQNRPYSANDLAANLDKEKHGKAAIQKSLDKLADNGKIFVKTNGKQKVYCFSHEPKQNLDELKRIERELRAHSSEQVKKLQELENEVRTQEATLNSLRCGMSLEEALKARDDLIENNGKLSLKLDELMEASGTEDLSEVKKKAEASYTMYNREFSKRKRICNEILECILESYPGSKKQLYAEIGINEV